MSARHRHYFKARLAWSQFRLCWRYAKDLPACLWWALVQQVETWARIGFGKPAPPSGSEK